MQGSSSTMSTNNNNNNDDNNNVNNGNGGLLQIKIRHWHAVGKWDWDFSEDTCAICQFSTGECCPNCKYPGNSCPPVQGICGHVFHKHCIDKIQESKCPLCRSPWKYNDRTEGLLEQIK